MNVQGLLVSLSAAVSGLQPGSEVALAVVLVRVDGELRKRLASVTHRSAALRATRGACTARPR